MLQGVLLVVIAANIEVNSGEKSAGDQQSMEQSIQIEQVTLPPQLPPEGPPEEVPPDFSQQQPIEEIPEPDAIALATPAPTQPSPPIQTPTPAVSPSPQSSPTPAPTPSPGATAKPTPQAIASLMPSPTPGPTPTPDPSEALPPQFANLPEPQKEAARSLKKYLEKQGLELPEELPPGFKDWAHYNEFINDDYNNKAKNLAKLPDPTKGSDSGAAPDNTNTTDPSTSPEANNANGTGDGVGSGKGGGAWFSIPGSKKNPRFDGNLNADDIKSRNLDGNFEEDSTLFGNKPLDDLAKVRDFKFDPNAPLSVPKPTPIPLALLKSGDVGLFMYISFEYDGNKFKAQWPSETIKNKKVTVQYYPPANPSQGKGFDMPWVTEFAEDHNNIAQAALQIYERRKRGS